MESYPLKQLVFIAIFTLGVLGTLNDTALAVRAGWPDTQENRQQRAIHNLEESVGRHAKRFREFMAKSSYMCYKNPDSGTVEEPFSSNLYIRIECRNKLAHGRLTVAYDAYYENIKWDGIFAEGRLSGEWKSYDREGRLRGQGSQKDQVGTTTYYYPDGSVRAVYHTKDFEMHGSGNDYFPSGQIKYDVMWDTGKIQRLIKYAEDGTVIDRYPPE